MAVDITKPVRFPYYTGYIGQYPTQDDLDQDQVGIKCVDGDRPIYTQERPKESHPSELPASWEAVVKSAKYIFGMFGMLIGPPREITSTGPYSSSTSDPSPTPLNFNHVRVALQTYYEPYLNIRRVSGDTLNLESCYINLAIVEAPDQRQRDKEDLMAQAVTFHRMPSYEKIFKVNMKAPISLEKLFDRRKLRDGREDVPKAILIQGRAGIGKTTLCKKLVHLYQSGLWRDRFDAVLWLPLRQLKVLNARGLKELLREKYFKYSNPSSKGLAKVLTNHTNKVLFILDGLDEVLVDTQKENGISLKEFLKHLLQQEHVVITSRPSGVDTSMLPKLDLELETVGFSMNNVRDYLHRVLSPDIAMTVQDYIKQTPLIQNLVNIPVQLDVICYSWDTFPWDKDSVTMTKLYQTMVWKLWCKDALRLQKSADGDELLPRHIKSLRQYQIDQLMAVENEYLGYLALKGIQENQIEFNEQSLCDAIEALNQHRAKTGREFLPFQLLETLKQTSFLHTADAELDIDDSQRAWYFLHLTFQEYFAAKWLAQHLEIKQNSPKISSEPMMTAEETKAYIRQRKCNPRYHIVWGMVAGMLQGETLVSFFGLLQGAPMDLIGGYHHNLLAACLEEGRSQLDTESVENLEKQLERWLQFEMMMNNGDNGRSILGGMSYVPEELLIRSIGQSDASKSYLIRTLHTRASLTQYVTEAFLNVLQDEDWRLREAAVIALGKQSIMSESTLEALVGVLQDENEDVRYSATNVLGKQSTLPESTLHALVSVLQDGDVSVRSSAADALGKQPTLPESVLQALMAGLQHESENMRSSAAYALGKQSTLPELVLHALIGVLQDENVCVRSSAADALGNQPRLPGSTLHALIGILQHENVNVRSSTAFVLGKQSTLSGSIVHTLIDALQHGNVNVSSSAAEALENQSTLPESALQALIGALQHENKSVRGSAASALRSQSTLSESALQSLIGALQHEDVNVRNSAAYVLEKQSKLLESTSHVSIGALKDKNVNVGSSAAYLLRSQSAMSESTILALIDALQHENLSVRNLAAYALKNQSTKSESTLRALIYMGLRNDANVKYLVHYALGIETTLLESTPRALIDILQDENVNARRSAVYLLRSQSTMTESTLQVLIGALQDGNGDVRGLAAISLREQSILPESVLQALIGALQDENEEIRGLAAYALRKQSDIPISTLHTLLGAVSHRSVRAMDSASDTLGTQSTLLASTHQSLIRRLQDEEINVRSRAAEELEMQSNLPESTLRALIGALQDKSWYVRRSAANALGNQSMLPESALQALVGALQHDNHDARQSAAYALGKHSTLPDSALQALIGALQDPNEDVRNSAATAIGNQLTMPVSTLEALISAWQYNDRVSREIFVAALEQHVGSTFMAIPSLSPSAIETLYKSFLIRYGSEHSASLWVEDNQVFFHTVQGYRKMYELCVEDVKRVVEAFDQVRKKGKFYL